MDTTPLKTRPALVSRIGLLAIILGGFAGQAGGKGNGEWPVPVGGNAYLTRSADGSKDRVDTTGIRSWQDAQSVFSIYCRTDRPAEVELVLRLRVPEGESVLRASVGGRVFEKSIFGAEMREVVLGKISVKAEGYLRVDLQGVRKSGPVFAEVDALIVRSGEKDLRLDYVQEPAGNRFYWGRRGPSVHLSYQPPAGKTVEYFYSELTVPQGQDPAGSFFMANGFGEGYFGMQVRGPDERWILFSVWSPFHTDKSGEIPEDQRVRVVAKGDGVKTGEFGNEGSGGQSFLTFPWKAGVTYRFLNSARPDGDGNTIYTAWFFPPEEGEWKLIAGFLRPKTNTHLTGIHSFLENFADRKGYLGRRANHANQWARDTNGQWHELTRARFTGDDIATRRYRLDFAGGVEGEGFFLRNGGFFAEPVKLGTVFERKPTPAKQPEIDFAALNGAK